MKPGNITSEGLSFHERPPLISAKPESTGNANGSPFCGPRRVREVDSNFSSSCVNNAGRCDFGDGCRILAALGAIVRVIELMTEPALTVKVVVPAATARTTPRLVTSLVT